VIALDIYGTVIDTAGIAARLARDFGARAPAAAQLWRDKQLEYSFRRALMRRYVDFDTVTAQALRYVSAQLGVPLSSTDEQALLQAYTRLPAFPEVRAALAVLAGAGHRILALSNGTERSVGSLLQHAGLADFFAAVVTVEPLCTFKPDPAVYAFLQRTSQTPPAEICLVSGNPFDVVGAKAYGLTAAWLQRDPLRPFDPWEFSPDVVLGSLQELPAALRRINFS
jgi:2-haloacid dehalogenase